MLNFKESIAALMEPIPAPTAERVVVFRYDKIGDLIVTSPLFRAIKAKQPDAYVILVCSQYNRAVLENMPEIDRIVVYNPKADWRDKIRFVCALRHIKATTAFVMSPSSGGYWMGWLSGAPKRAGIIMSYRLMQRLLAPLLLTVIEAIDVKALNLVPDRVYHQSEIALRLAARCGFPRPTTVVQCAPTTLEARRWAEQITRGSTGPKRRILLHLGEAWRNCGMSEEQLATLAARIRAGFPDATLLITAGPAEPSYLAAVRRYFPEVLSEAPLVLASPPQNLPRALLFSGLSFDFWNALIESASVVVTPDTGAVHLASAHQRPVVAVYAPDRFNTMTSLFGPWETLYRTLRGGGPSEALSEKILASTRDLLEEPIRSPSPT